MKKITKSQKILLWVSIALMIISMIGTALVQSNFGKAAVKTYYVTTAELAEMIRENNEVTGKNIQPTFTEDANARFSFMTLIPNTATADNPVPAVICIHGGANTKEMQMNGYVELVRRGFAVITIDMAEHGYSDAAINTLTKESYGALAAVEYAMSLPCVDETKVGVTGHSMGNQACYYAIANTNIAGYPNPRIAAWVQGAGSMYAPQMTAEMCEGLVWTMSVDKYDEFDSLYFSSYTILETPLAAGIVQIVYPEFSAASVDENVFYTPAGTVAVPNNGNKVDADTAFRLVNPPITHPMFHFTTTGTEITVNGFYNGLGTPSGAEYIEAGNQIWPVCVVFELLGMIGFFMMLFPLVSILAQSKVFEGIKRPVVESDKLPSGRSGRELIVWIVTAVVSIAFSFITYVKYYPQGNSILDLSVYAINDVPNGIAAWTLLCGLFAVIVMLLGYAVRKLLYLKSGIEIRNPFEVAKLDSISQFLKTILFAGVVLILMYLPVYLARYLFNADFRICSFVVAAGSIKRLPLIVLKYVPLWLVFYIPNAIMNAGTRYKDIPEWITTTVSAVANGLSLVVFVFIQYSTLFSTGALWNGTAGMAGIVAFAIIPCLFYAAYSARYIYKKTGNVWAAGMINGALMCFVTTFATRYMTDLVITF